MVFILCIAPVSAGTITLPEIEEIPEVFALPGEDDSLSLRTAGGGSRT